MSSDSVVIVNGARTPMGGLQGSLSAVPATELASTAIADIAPLGNLSKLEKLNLFNTGVVDIAPLADLGRLKWLNLSGTDVTDLSPLKDLTRLHYLHGPDGSRAGDDNTDSPENRAAVQAYIVSSGETD